MPRSPEFCVFHRAAGNYEEVELTEDSVNLGPERIGPHCFELLRVLGKGGYGKVPLFSSFSSLSRLTLSSAAAADSGGGDRSKC